MASIDMRRLAMPAAVAILAWLGAAGCQSNVVLERMAAEGAPRMIDLFRGSAGARERAREGRAGMGSDGERSGAGEFGEPAEVKPSDLASCECGRRRSGHMRCACEGIEEPGRRREAERMAVDERLWLEGRRMCRWWLLSWECEFGALAGESPAGVPVPAVQARRPAAEAQPEVPVEEEAPAVQARRRDVAEVEREAEGEVEPPAVQARRWTLAGWLAGRWRGRPPVVAEGVAEGVADPSVAAAQPEPAAAVCPCAAPAQRPQVPAGATAFSRTAKNELEQLFPRLPNPDVVIYVYPHLATSERVPVPGYTTAVPLFERVEYALPGEVGTED